MRSVHRREASFSAMLLATMAMSTITFFALAVAASELQDEFNISKLQLGLLAAINTGVGGLVAPHAGRLSDRLGGRRAMGFTLATSGISAVLMALSQSYAMLFAASAVAGIPQGWGNPSCNKAIATGIERHRRGIITGVKQSGVQFAVFLTGFFVPWLTESYGWRSAMWLAAAMSFAFLLGLGAITVLEQNDTDATSDEVTPTTVRLPPFVTQVAIYGFLLGIVGGGLGRFLPLFAEEEVGFTIQQAGWVFGLQGLIAIPFRLLSGIALDRGVSARKMLLAMGIGGAASVLLILAASPGPTVLLWVGTILGGMTLGSWNTAANVSMIRQGAVAGRATGRLMLGFLIGLTVGGPAVGWSIDNFDYAPAWIASALLALSGAAIIAYRPKAPVDGSLP